MSTPSFASFGSCEGAAAAASLGALHGGNGATVKGEDALGEAGGPSASVALVLPPDYGMHRQWRVELLSAWALSGLNHLATPFVPECDARAEAGSVDPLCEATSSSVDPLVTYELCKYPECWRGDACRFRHSGNDRALELARLRGLSAARVLTNGEEEDEHGGSQQSSVDHEETARIEALCCVGCGFHSWMGCASSCPTLNTMNT